MPAISKIRFTNVVYENGEKRYNDEIFQFDGHNGVLVLENGGGKTVFVQTAIQAVLPHASLGERKIKNTLLLESGASHIAIEWIINEKPRRYAMTAVTLFMSEKGVDSYKYAYEYSAGDKESIEEIPFSKITEDGNERACGRLEMLEYYRQMGNRSMNARLFDTIRDYQEHIEQNYHIISTEWNSIARINSAEGDVDKFFEGCKTTTQLVDQLLIPVVEDAISANEKGSFTEIFEKNRERFKKHKQLKKTIDQSKALLNQLDGYVEYFKAYKGKMLELERVKTEMKAIYKFTVEEEKEINSNIVQNEAEAKKLDVMKSENERKQASHEIAKCENSMSTSKLQYEKSMETLQRAREAWDENKTRLCNLEVAGIKKSLKEADESIVQYKSQLDETGGEKDLEKLKKRLDVNSACLSGYFKKEMSNIQKIMDLISKKKTKESEKLSKMKQNVDILEKERRNLLKEESSLEERINIRQKDMHDIEKEILGNFMHEKIEQEHPKWVKRLDEIEKKREFYVEKLNNIQSEKEKLSKDIAHSNAVKAELSRKLAVKGEKLLRMKSEHDEILEKLKQSNKDWQYYTFLYEKQQSIISFLEGRSEKALADKEEILDAERRARRLQDEYGMQEYFAADPFVEGLVSGWKEQFKYLETGGQYLERAAKALGIMPEELFENHPTWPITLVTSDDETQKLLERLGKNSDDMTYPVAVISSEEARKIASGNERHLPEYVFPKHWKANISSEGFESWKKDIEEVSQQARLKREEKESELSYWRRILEDTRDFFIKNPYEEYSKIEKELKIIGETIKEEESNLEKWEARTDEIDEEIKESNEKLNQIELESMDISSKCAKAHSYFLKRDDVKKAHFKLKEIVESIERKDSEILEFNEKIDRLDKVLNGMEKELFAADLSKKGLEKDRLYNEVKNEKPSHDGRTRAVLEIERKALKDGMEQKQKGRSEIQEKLDKALSRRGEIGIELSNRLKKAADVVIYQDFEFPIDGQGQIERLIENGNALMGELKETEMQFEKANRAYLESKNKHEFKLEEFKKRYDRVEIFSRPLREVGMELKQEREKIRKKKEQIDNTLERLLSEKNNIASARIKLENYDKMYRYLASDVEEKKLGQEKVQEYPYARESIIEAEADNLDAALKKVTEMKNELEKRKYIFIKNCNEKISDMKLREIAVSGIQKRTTYEEVLDWHKRLQERIQRTIEIAQSGIREYDKDIQHLIHYIHTHLKKLADEIESIPKKTRVRVDGSFKEIYKFDVPAWSEQDGKEELRRHMEWMSERLESDEFKDENGIEDKAKAKAAVEKWLQPKQLLKNVMNGRWIKVKCRKVTNDNKVLGALFSWETSNEWSGGEKWSKNMALFLGILNYVAEKRQHIIPSRGRNRSVIMDNPFGKASSEHVLNPVFFVAEQLGFQIIALTAHAEGKFIRDYFPVVYSCRLRPVRDMKTSVFSKEKSIRYAYLKDNYPDSLERLYEQKQLEI